MSRTRASARQAGTRFERQVADYLAAALGDERIDRRVRTGGKDRGDVCGLRVGGRRVVVECKDYAGRERLPQWLREAEAERGNDDADYGVVAHKRRGCADPREQYVTMTLATLAALAAGGRDLLEDDYR